MWRAWLADVTERLEPLLSTVLESRDEWTVALANRGEPVAEVQPAADGQLYLTGVKLSAWEVIHLPRQWSGPDREQDEDPYEQLADFVERVWEAMDEWKQSLVHLVLQ
jgi:broad specificity phosphatase PhoE